MCDKTEEYFVIMKFGLDFLERFALSDHIQDYEFSNLSASLKARDNVTLKPNWKNFNNPISQCLKQGF